VKKYCYALIILSLVFSSFAHAKPEQHKIFGTVTQCGNDAIRLSNTRVTTDYGQIEVATNYNGEYEIPDLYPGYYEISFSKTTYKDKSVLIKLDGTEDLLLDVCMCQDIDFNFITPTPLKPVYQGDDYFQVIEVEGGCKPYECSILGSLPQGLIWDPENCGLSGKIEINKDNKGNFPFVVKIVDYSGAEYTKNYSITVYEQLYFITRSLGSVIVDSPFKKIIRVVGGKRPYTYSIVSGSLPQGVTLSSTGILEGIPTATGETYFVVKVVDDNGKEIQHGFTLTVVEKLVIKTPRLDVAIVGFVYNMKFNAGGGAYGPHQWEISSEDIPRNFTLDKDSGVLSGTPKDAQKIPIIIQVRDTDGHIAKKEFLFYAVQPLEIANLTLSPGLLNNQFSEFISIQGGVPPYTFTCSDNLPDGLYLDPNTGIISGIVSVAEMIQLNVTVIDSTYPKRQSDEERVTIIIDEEFKFTTNSVLPDAIQNIPLNQINDYVISVGGGIGPYSFKIIDGALPAGVDLNVGQNVELIRLPYSNGHYRFSLQAIDSEGSVAQKNFFWHVIPEMAVLTKTLPNAVIYQPYKELLVAENGTPPYFWNIISGKLPKGLELINDNNIWTISGIPLEGTNYQEMTFMVSDSHPTAPFIKEDIVLALSVIENDLTITTNALPEGQVGQAYIAKIHAAMGQEPYELTLTSGKLPDGLSWTVRNQDVWIQGRPEISGDFPIRFKLVDNDEYSRPVYRDYIIHIHDNIIILSEFLEEASRGEYYSKAIQILNKDDDVSCELTEGILPDGLELDSQTCTIEGIPDDKAHSQSFCIKASKPGQFGSFDVRCFSIIILEDPNLIIKTGFMRPNDIFWEYFHFLEARGGTKPYIWFVSGGYLPKGITFYQEDDILYFEGSAEQCGLFEFDIKVIDSSPVRRSVTKHYHLQIYCSEDITPDITPPEPPSLAMSFPELDQWSNGIITVQLNPGFDEDSGISGYSYEWNQEKTTSLDNAIEITNTHIVSHLLPNGENHYLHVASVDNVGNASETIHIGPFKVHHPDGHVLIVGGGESSDPFWSITKVLTVNAYRDFRAMGYQDDQIDFHIHSQMISIDYDEVPDDIVDDCTPTADEIGEAIRSAESKVDENNRYILYLQGHGTDDARLRVAGFDDYITAQEIDVALDFLQSRTNCEVIVIIEACFSGTFIEPLAGDHRVIITSAGEERYNTDSMGRIAFSRYLLAKLREDKKTLRDAFIYAHMCMTNMKFPEPQMDDTFDGIANDEDGQPNGKADHIIIDLNGSFVGKPIFNDVTIIPNDTTDYLANALLYTSDVRITDVFVQVIQPNNDILFGNTTTEFQRVYLKPITKLTYENTLPELTQAGEYTFVFNATNKLGEMADPHIFTLKYGDILPGDLNSNNDLDLSDAIIALKILSGFRDMNVQIDASVDNNPQIGLIEAMYVLHELSEN